VVSNSIAEIAQTVTTPKVEERLFNKNESKVDGSIPALIINSLEGPKIF